MIIRTNKQIDTHDPLIDNIRTLQRSLAVQRECLVKTRASYRRARSMVRWANCGGKVSNTSLDRGGWLNACKRTKRALRETCATVATLLAAIRASRTELLLSLPIATFADTCVVASEYRYGGTA